MSLQKMPESPFFRSIILQPDKAIEKCRRYIKGEDRSFVWAMALSRLATRLVNEEVGIRKQKLRLKFKEGDDAIQLSLDVLGLIFSYLSPQAAAQLQRVDRKWHGVQTLHSVQWTIGPHAFLDQPYGRFSFTNANRMSLLNSGFVSNATAFQFGAAAPTPILMLCIEVMPSLKRIQMPTSTDVGRGVDENVRGHVFAERLIAAHATDITHLAVSLRPCINSVFRFPNITSLLVSYGSTTPLATLVAVESLIRLMVDDIRTLPMIQHLGLHHAAKISGINVNRIVALLEERSSLITLSLTGMFYIQADEIRRLLHPACGLRSLAVHVPHIDGGDSWNVDGILAQSNVSLLVLCLPGVGKLLSKSLLWALFVAGFKPLRARNVNIDGQRSYDAHPFKRSGAVDVVWGLTGGSIFAAE
jgi:hypothetical protein